MHICIGCVASYACTCCMLVIVELSLHLAHTDIASVEDPIELELSVAVGFSAQS